jgi:hypothetical protein
MLGVDQVKPYLLDEDRWVRRAALDYFKDTWPADVDLIPTVLETYRRYGAEEARSGLAHCREFVVTQQSLQELAEVLADANEELAILHLNRAIAAAPVDLLIRHEERLVATRNLDPATVQRIRRRGELAHRPGEELWPALQDFAERSEDLRYVGDIDHAYLDDLIDALAPRPVPDAKTIVRLLEEQPEEGTWLEIFLVDLAGARGIAQRTICAIGPIGRLPGSTTPKRSTCFVPIGPSRPGISATTPAADWSGSAIRLPKTHFSGSCRSKKTSESAR